MVEVTIRRGEGAAEGLGVGRRDGVLDGAGDEGGAVDAVGAKDVGTWVDGVALGRNDGRRVTGLKEITGTCVVGAAVIGFPDGFLDGAWDGVRVGADVVGAQVGLRDGPRLGLVLGNDDGSFDEGDAVGKSVGSAVG